MKPTHAGRHKHTHIHANKNARMHTHKNAHTHARAHEHEYAHSTREHEYAQHRHTLTCTHGTHVNFHMQVRNISRHASCTGLWQGQTSSSTGPQRWRPGDTRDALVGLPFESLAGILYQTTALLCIARVKVCERRKLEGDSVTA